MSKRNDGSQLGFELLMGSKVTAFQKSETGSQIMPFVDSATLQVRRDAVRRVAASGIFHVPSGLRQK